MQRQALDMTNRLTGCATEDGSCSLCTVSLGYERRNAALQGIRHAPGCATLWHAACEQEACRMQHNIKSGPNKLCVYVSWAF